MKVIIPFHTKRDSRRLLCVLCILSGLSFNASAQEPAATRPATPAAPTVETKEIHGQVFDAATRQPVAGIRVSAYDNTRFAAMTDDNGEYTIKVPVYIHSLSLSAEGYNMVQQALGDATGTSRVIKTYMYSSDFTETYQSQTLATSSRSARVTYNNNDLTIDNQLQNSLGGDVRTLMRSAIPGSGVAMLIGGINSLNANAQPLIVIDGVIQDMQLNRPSLHEGFFNNMFANIMVEDIEKISVLKNGTAIYGAKGANGVIIIETKRNKSMATRIDVSIGGSYELLPKSVDMMNSEQFRIYASELIGTTGTKSNSFKFLNTDPNYYYYPMYHNNTDWSKQVMDEAFTQNYSINVQGGDDVANYNLSVGYAGADATLKNTSFSRFNMRFNTDIVMAKNLSVRFDASYSDVTRDMRDMGIKDDVTDGIISSPSFLSLIKSPFLNPYAFDTQGHVSSYIAEADDYLSDVLRENTYRTSLANPLAILHYGDGTNKNYFGNRNISIAVRPQWHINRYWTATEHFAFSLVNTDANYYLPTNGVPDYDIAGLGRVENRAAALAGKQTIVMSDTYFNYARRFNAHGVNVRGGMRYYRNSYKLNIQQGYNSGNDKTPNMSNSFRFKDTDGTDDQDIDMTYYAQADYSYADRYYLTAGVSMDGSSKFGTDAAEGIKIGNYSWGFFPSVEAAWVMSNEEWFRLRGIDYMKFNVGFDISGNDDINPNASRSYFVAKKHFDQIAGITLGNIGNTRLQWETTRRFTAGIQLAAFHNRLSVGFNYFRSNTRNLLALNALSYLTGMQSNWTNSGKLSNEGFDVNASVKLIAQKNWSWELAASAGHYKNRLKELPNGETAITTDMYNATILSQIGSPIALFYGYKTDGVFASDAEASAAALFQRNNIGQVQWFKAGDMKFVDTDNDHEITSADMQVIGDPNPDIYGNITSRLSYKRLSLSLTFNYSLGNDIYNYQRSILESGAHFFNQTTNMLQRWTYEGQQTNVPRASYLDEMGNSRFSDRWIEDGSYLRLRNVTLSYTLPINNVYIQGITLWGSANNLFTLTKYLGSDPEFAQTNSPLGWGIDTGLPNFGRSFSLGVKINL